MYVYIHICACVTIHRLPDDKWEDQTTAKRRSQYENTQSAGFSRRVLWMFLLLLLLCCKSFPYPRIFATPPFSSLLCQDSTHIILYGTPAFTLHPRSVRPKDRSRLQHGAPSSCHASNLSAKMPNSSIDKQLPCVPPQAFSTPSFQPVLKLLQTCVFHLRVCFCLPYGLATWKAGGTRQRRLNNNNTVRSLTQEGKNTLSTCTLKSYVCVRPALPFTRMHQNTRIISSLRGDLMPIT